MCLFRLQVDATSIRIEFNWIVIMKPFMSHRVELNMREGQEKEREREYDRMRINGNNNQVVWKFVQHDEEYFTIESMELDGSLHTLWKSCCQLSHESQLNQRFLQILLQTVATWLKEKRKKRKLKALTSNQLKQISPQKVQRSQKGFDTKSLFIHNLSTKRESFARLIIDFPKKILKQGDA